MRRRPPRLTLTDKLVRYTTLFRSLARFGLGSFGPSIASGLVAGAPQLGAGAAVGTAIGAGAAFAMGGGAAVAAARGVAGGALSAIRAGTSMGSAARSEEHTSELQSLMRISYAVFCLKKKKRHKQKTTKQEIEG